MAQFSKQQEDERQTTTETSTNPNYPPKVRVSKISPPLPARLHPDIRKKVIDKINKDNQQTKKPTYAQVAKEHDINLLKLHKTFPALPAKKLSK